MRSYRYLEYNGVKYPCRITDGSAFQGDAFINQSSVTHTATIPLNSEVVINTTVTDERGLSYRVIDAVEILGKLRLKLERR